MSQRLTKRPYHWLVLSLISFTVIVAWIIYETRWFYPEMQRYFGDAGTLVGQQLASRSRNHLQSALSELAYIDQESADQEASSVSIITDLEMAWGFLNIAIYRETYPCTATSLTQIDAFIDSLATHPAPSPQESFVRLLPVLECVTEIEQRQWDKRSLLAVDVVERINVHQQILLGGTLILYFMGIIFWWFYEKQRKAFSVNLRDTVRWKRQALHDPLTGALNRRALDTDLNLHFERKATSDHSFALLMCDIDYFKCFNDSKGHAEGDKVLQRVVAALQNILRQEDHVYRYGGEELAIILSGAKADDGMDIGFRALEAVEQLKIPNPDSPSPYITISIGISTASAATYNADTLIRAADKKLYQAKHNGRNCIAT